MILLGPLYANAFTGQQSQKNNADTVNQINACLAEVLSQHFTPQFEAVTSTHNLTDVYDISHIDRPLLLLEQPWKPAFEYTHHVRSVLSTIDQTILHIHRDPHVAAIAKSQLVMILAELRNIIIHYRTLLQPVFAHRKYARINMRDIHTHFAGRI